MPAPDRVISAVMAADYNLFVNKELDPEEEPNFVMVGCTNSKDYGLANKMVELNCDAGKITVPSNEKPTYDLQIQGFVFQYPSGEVATNVSALEFEQWGAAVPQPFRQYKLAGKYKDDPVRTFWATIASFRESGQNGEARTYTVAFAFKDSPVITAQA
jgi:hypothetical protein